MLFRSFLVAAGCAALAIAMPAELLKERSTCRAVQRNANFDDLQTIPGTTIVPVQTPYMGLFYQAFNLINVVQTNLLPGVVPHSPNNYAGAGVYSEVLAGTPMLTTNYPNSKIDSFTLQNFYFGCTTQLANGATALPAACNVQIIGYRGSDNSVSNAKQVCSQQFQYNPSTNLGVQQMAYSGAVKNCKDIDFAIVTFTPPGGQALTAPLIGFLIDDVKYTTKAKKC